jgi:hypothetical protein
MTTPKKPRDSKMPGDRCAECNHQRRSHQKHVGACHFKIEGTNQSRCPCPTFIERELLLGDIDESPSGTNERRILRASTSLCVRLRSCYETIPPTLLRARAMSITCTLRRANEP